jgi:hypothetical protein
MLPRLLAAPAAAAATFTNPPPSPIAPSYGTDGGTFTKLGPALTLNNARQFFMGHRFGIFNHATQALGGATTGNRFGLTAP